MNNDLNIDVLNGLVDHTNKLNIIHNKAKSIMNEFNKNKDIGNAYLVTEEVVDRMDALLTNCLYKAAHLSRSVNDIELELKEYYEETYSHAPALGKKLFYQQYYQLHKPYDKVKNYIWKQLFLLEDYRLNNFN